MRTIALLLGFVIAVSSVSADARLRKKKKHRHSKPRAVQMDLEFAYNGSLISTPHIAAEIGKTATITETASDNTVYTIEVTPAVPKAGQIQMAFEISRTIGGRKEVIAAPRVTTLNGEKARIEQKGAAGQVMSVDVTAKL